MTDSLALHQTPALDRIIERMDARLRLFARDADRRERFLLMYRTFKRELRASIQAGRFLDAEWTEAICCRMAEMYFEADDAYVHRREKCPEAWLHCFDSAVAGRTNLLQDMLLGMNAHINYDLPLCTYDTLIKFHDLDRAQAEPGHTDLMFDTTLKRRYLDFLMINQIAWESIPVIQDVLLGRFSKLLNVANILSLRFTKYIGATIIVDYRDRAWAHTLLLATMRDAEEVTTVNRLTTQFAMEAATLVARLTLHPVQLVQALRSGPRRIADDARSIEVVRLLAERLRSHLTARVARRALVEYGPAIHPILERILDEHPGDTTLRLELYKIMAQHPAPSVARALYRRLDPADGKSYHLALLYLAAMCGDGLRCAFDEQRIRAHIAQEAGYAKRYLADFHALGAHTRALLLEEALRIRFGDAIRRILYLTSLLRPGQGLVAAAARIGQGCQTLAPDAVAEILRAALPHEERARTLASLDPRHTQRPESAAAPSRQEASPVESVPAHLPEDPWLRAVSQSRELQATIASYLETRSAPEEPSIVRENSMLSTIEKVLYLKNCELFREIPGEDLAQIAGLVRRYRFGKGEMLIEEGRPGEALYIVLDGEIDVIAGASQLARVGRHAVLGEMSLLSEMPCSASCVAAHTGHALRISRVDFLQFLLDYPEIGLALIQVLIQRLRNANLRIQEQSHDPSGGPVVLPGTWTP